MADAKPQRVRRTVGSQPVGQLEQVGQTENCRLLNAGIHNKPDFDPITPRMHLSVLPRSMSVLPILTMTPLQ
jgi:hypothetical protein